MNENERWLNESEENRRLYAQEGLIVEVTQAIWAALEKKSLSKADLARLLETSKANITQLLDGSRNMTLRTLADIAYKLDLEPHFGLYEKGEAVGWPGMAEMQNIHPPLRRSECERLIRAALAVSPTRTQDAVAEVLRAALNRDRIIRGRSSTPHNAYFDALGKAEHMLDSAIEVYISSTAAKPNTETNA